MPKSGTGRIYQRGGVWWIDYSFRGSRQRESTKSAKREDAVKLLRKRMGEMGSGVLVGPSAERVTFEELRQIIETEYKVNGRRSLPQLKVSLNHLARYFAQARAVDLNAERVGRYIIARQEEGAANATIRLEISALKRAFNLAVQSGRLAHKPYIPTVQVDNARQGFLDGGELDAVLAALPEDARAVVRFLMLTGWRKMEVLSLRWSQVDFRSGMVRLEPGTTKNKEGRSFPFNALPQLRSLLEELREQTRVVEREKGEIVPWVFHRNGVQIRSFRGAWEKACTAAGVPGMLIHDLRRTAVRSFERAGVPRSVAMKLSGHKTEAVYRRYAIADHVALTEGVEKLAKLYAEPVAQSKVVPLVTTVTKGASAG